MGTEKNAEIFAPHAFVKFILKTVLFLVAAPAFCAAFFGVPAEDASLGEAYALKAVCALIFFACYKIGQKVGPVIND